MKRKRRKPPAGVTSSRDPFVAEVHEVRRNMLAAHGGNLGNLVASMKSLTVAKALAKLGKSAHPKKHGKAASPLRGRRNVAACEAQRNPW